MRWSSYFVFPRQMRSRIAPSKTNSSLNRMKRTSQGEGLSFHDGRINSPLVTRGRWKLSESSSHWAQYTCPLDFLESRGRKIKRASARQFTQKARISTHASPGCKTWLCCRCFRFFGWIKFEDRKHILNTWHTQSERNTATSLWPRSRPRSVEIFFFFSPFSWITQSGQQLCKFVCGVFLFKESQANNAFPDWRLLIDRRSSCENDWEPLDPPSCPILQYAQLKWSHLATWC